jgi:hypothetical protein
LQALKGTRFNPKQYASSREELKPEKGSRSNEGHLKASKDPKGKKGF